MTINAPAAASGRPTILLVHGAWHGAWCWELLAPELRDLGWRVETVELPSASADPDNTAGMYDDACTVRNRLSDLGGEVTVLAHSYGGLPATEAATVPGVTRLVYLAAMQLEECESLSSLSGGALPHGETGTLKPHEDPRDHLYADAPDDVAQWAAERLVLQSVKSFSEPLTTAAWKTVPSTYIVCERDRAIDPGFQEVMAARAERSYRIPASHSPFLSMPAELARLITADAAL
ncbi:alpha/beta fold hydrolase [Streptomyces sp. NRRL S-340]|uniref:alpha/beta fold hydrolase n=1 Tax=Streptomyces sp. NRRL S-340 TaxID=1463901 RepID=UPI00055FEF06|nr:alpha/beta fold hydrolase [Streptomyces sp. NRRL S-340]